MKKNPDASSPERALFRRMREEIPDSIDEELEMEMTESAAEEATDRLDQEPRITDPSAFRRMYFKELRNRPGGSFPPR